MHLAEGRQAGIQVLWWQGGTSPHRIELECVYGGGATFCELGAGVLLFF